MNEQQATEAAAEPIESQVNPDAPTTSRAEHLQWCKGRAKAFLPGDPGQAFASMMSDLSKHEELSSHCGIEMGTMLMATTPGWTKDASAIGEFIDGFN